MTRTRGSEHFILIRCQAARIPAALMAALMLSPPTAPALQAPAPPAQPSDVSATARSDFSSQAKEKTYTVPAGTKVLLSLKSGVNTKTARPGDSVYLISTFPVIFGSHVLIPAGVYVQGSVDSVERPGRIKGRAKLLMHFTTMIFPNGQVVGVPGSVDNLPGSGGPAVKGKRALSSRLAARARMSVTSPEAARSVRRAA
jgi:hypothetical protein